MTHKDRDTQETAARKLLVFCLRIPSGVAARQVEVLTDEELAAVCEVANEPLRTRRQVLKAVLAAVAEPAKPQQAASPEPELTVEPEEPASPEVVVDDEPEDTVVVE